MKNLFCIVIVLVISQSRVIGKLCTDSSVVILRTDNGIIYKTTLRSNAYKFDRADYSIFIPSGVTQIRGILVHQHGCTMEGTGAATAHDIQYQAFAKKWHLAIIAPDIYPRLGYNCRDWTDPEEGSGPALLAVIEKFSLFSRHAELNYAPWLLWGHSGGGYWVLKMMTQYQDRILASFCYSAAFDPELIYPSSVNKIPIMLRHAGKDDFNGCWQTALHTFSTLRKMDGCASIAYTPNQTHNFSYVRFMAIPFFEAALKQRLPDVGSITLKDIDINKAWFCDTLTLTVQKLSSFERDIKSRRGMSVLPDSISAAKWKEFVITGTVADHSPPPVPHDLKINVKKTHFVYLSWKTKGDVESPIKYFNIYKNGELIGRFPKSGSYQTFNTNGDNAMPVIPPAMKFNITSAIKKTDKFAVSAVNQFDLESATKSIAQCTKR